MTEGEFRRDRPAHAGRHRQSTSGFGYALTIPDAGNTRIDSGRAHTYVRTLYRVERGFFPTGAATATVKKRVVSTSNPNPHGNSISNANANATTDTDQTAIENPTSR